MAVHTVSIAVAVVQFVSYVLLSTCLQYVYYYRRAHQPEQWKSQPSKLRLVPLTTAPRNAAVAPLPPSAPEACLMSEQSSDLQPTARLASHTASPLIANAPQSSFSSSLQSSLRRLFVCWMYPTKWLLFPSLPRVPHRHPYQPLITTVNLTMSACVAGCVTEAFMRDRSALTSHAHFLPALALPRSFFPSAAHPSLPHVACTLLLSVLWQCVCE